MVLGYFLVTPRKYRMVGKLLFHFMLDPTDSLINDTARVHPGMRYLALQERKNAFPSPAYCLKFIMEERLPCI